MLVVFLKIAQNASHVVMLLTADREAPDAIIVIVLDDLIGLALVTEIVLVEDNQLLLLVLLNDQIELRVSAAVWNAGVADLHEDVHLVGVFFDEPKSLLHVAGEPIDVVFEVLDHVHLDTQLSFNYNNSMSSIRVGFDGIVLF